MFFLVLVGGLEPADGVSVSFYFSLSLSLSLSLLWRLVLELESDTVELPLFFVLVGHQRLAIYGNHAHVRRAKDHDLLACFRLSFFLIALKVIEEPDVSPYDIKVIQF
jgi:hypothetical protein